MQRAKYQMPELSSPPKIRYSVRNREKTPIHDESPLSLRRLVRVLIYHQFIFRFHWGPLEGNYSELLNMKTGNETGAPDPRNHIEK